MDRQDGSQYPQRNTGEVALPANAVDDAQLQYHADQHFASVHELIDYINPDTVPATHGQDITRQPGHRRTVAHARPVYLSQMVTPQTAYLAGINFRETSGTASATVTVYQGGDAGQKALLYITLAANESVRDMFPLPIEANGGIYVGITGQANGILYTEETRYVQ